MYGNSNNSIKILYMIIYYVFVFKNYHINLLIFLIKLIKAVILNICYVILHIVILLLYCNFYFSTNILKIELIMSLKFEIVAKRYFLF